MNLFEKLSENFKKDVNKNTPSKSNFTGAGVILLNPEGNKILLVHGKQHHKWSLPKGSINENETLMMCAIRELQEETGIKLNECDFTEFSYTSKKYVYFIAQPREINRDKLEIRDKREISRVAWRQIEKLKAPNNWTKCNCSLKSIIPSYRKKTK